MNLKSRLIIPIILTMIVSFSSSYVYAASEKLEEQINGEIDNSEATTVETSEEAEVSNEEEYLSEETNTEPVQTSDVEDEAEAEDEAETEVANGTSEVVEIATNSIKLSAKNNVGIYLIGAGVLLLVTDVIYTVIQVIISKKSKYDEYDEYDEYDGYNYDIEDLEQSESTNDYTSTYLREDTKTEDFGLRYFGDNDNISTQTDTSYSDFNTSYNEFDSYTNSIKDDTDYNSSTDSDYSGLFDDLWGNSTEDSDLFDNLWDDKTYYSGLFDNLWDEESDSYK